MDNKNTILPNTFPKAEKLKSRKAIDALFKTGKSFFIHPYKVFFQVIAVEKKSMVNGQWSMEDPQETTTKYLTNAAPELATRHSPLTTAQAGFAVSTKNFKHAVDRNRIKRLGREAYRLNKQPLLSHLATQGIPLQVFFVFTNRSLPTFAQVQQAMQACLRKLIKTVSIEDLKI